MNNLIKITANGTDFKVGNPIKYTWDETSNMNNFKTPGVYEIYGERTKKDDNLPIINSNPGHSIAARLTVVASTLQPANNEICLTQFLMLSNRKGGDGNMYVRTYNENNSPADNGWTLWKKFQGVEEGYIFTDTRKLNQDFGLQTYEVGLNYMVDNGNYSGVYVNEDAIIQKGDLDSNGNGWGEINTDITKIKFIETFNITTINDYAVAGEVNNLLIKLGLGSFQKERQICQVKTATDFFSGTSSIKKRVYLGNDADYGNGGKWSDWEDIGGSGSGNSEVDITDALKTYSLYTLINQGLAKEGVTYKASEQMDYVNNLKLDLENKIVNHISTNGSIGATEVTFYITLKTINGYKNIIIDCYNDGLYYKYIIIPHNSTSDFVTVSADMTSL